MDGGPVRPNGAGVMGVGGREEEDEDEQLEEGELRIGEEAVRKQRVEDRRDVRKLGDPRKPSQEEVDEHALSHIPYRNWCAICVRCKGKDLDHRKAVHGEKGISEYAFDYCFPGDELGFKLAVLVGREKITGMFFAATVPTKGSSGRFAIDEVVDYMGELGDRTGRVIVKTDQEPAIKTFARDLVDAREEERTIVEESPVKSSGSNGRAERAVQTVEGQIRMLLLSLEARLGRSVDAREPIVTYIPKYAAYLLNRLKVGKDGKTAYERCKGKRATVLGLEFGEKLLYKVKAESKQAKIRARWEYGIFVGVRTQSNEVWIATPEKTFSVRSVRRTPCEERWTDDNIRWVRRPLWNRYKDDRGADGDLPEDVPQAVAPEPPGPRGGVVFVQTRDRVPRDFYIKKTDAEKHGYTRGCAGCSSWFRGLGRQPHTEACRERFRHLMRDEARVQHAEGKRKEFEEMQAEKRRRKEEKSQRKRKAEEDADDAERAQREQKNPQQPVVVDGGERRERAEGSAKNPQQPVVVDGGERHERAEGGTKNPQQPVVQDGGERHERDPMIREGSGQAGAGGQKRKAEEEADDQERADRDKWKDFCAVGRGEVIEEEDARKWVCELGGAEDARTGLLDLVEVAAARREEIAFMKARGLWEVVPRPEGVTPCSVRWVDVLKADGTTRSRLVARDFKGNDNHRDDLFAATPPLEAFRAILSRAATETSMGVWRKLMFIDVKKAHLIPKCNEDVYIELPAEAEGGPGMCGKLNYWLYGFRKAASAWEKHYAQVLEERGFRRGLGCAVLFYHAGRDLSVAVHGDDFALCGYGADLDWAANFLKAAFEIKVRAVLGGEPGDVQQATVLGRTVRWRSWGIEYEADTKHRQMLLQQFGLDGASKALDYNGVRDPGDDNDDDGNQEEDTDCASEFRAAVARLNFLGQDSPELQFPAKEASREMARPTIGGWARLKKTLRFLVGRRKVVWQFAWQEQPCVLTVFADSDWGGDFRSRKSSSGGAIMLGKHCLKTWSSTQGPIALSSAEAEFYALVDAVLRAKGALNMLSEVGIVGLSPVVEACTDSSAVKSFVSKRGLGKMRHLELRDLWLQREVGDGKVVVRKVAGHRNPADAMTKFLGKSALQERLRKLNLDLEWAPHAAASGNLL